MTTGQLVDLYCKYWGDGIERVDRAEATAPHEANFLKLDCSKLKSVFGWQPRWHITEAVEKTVEWTKAWQSGADINSVMEKQIMEYMAENK